MWLVLVAQLTAVARRQGLGSDDSLVALLNDVDWLDEVPSANAAKAVEAVGTLMLRFRDAFAVPLRPT